MARRQEKYPDTEIFKYHNQNPHNRITGDCVVRAISFATGIPYNEVVMDQAKFQCKTGFEGTYEVAKFMTRAYGYEKCKQPRHEDGTKYTMKEFIGEHPKGTYVILLPNHCTVVKNGVNYDIWDCTQYDKKVGNYFRIK